MKTLSAALAAALLIVSPGLEAHRAFAQIVEAPLAPKTWTVPVAVGAVVGMQPLLPAPAALTKFSLPTVAVTPVVTLAHPGLQGPQSPLGQPALGARGLASASQAAASPLAERSTKVAKIAGAAGPVARATGENAQGLGSRVFSALLGGDVGSLASAVAPAAEEAPAARSGLAPSSPVTEAAGYAVARRELARLASVFGLAFSLPVAGPMLAQSLLDEAATKKVVFSDYDDTLDKFNSVASPETVKAIVDVLKAGKTVVVITDRPDAKKPGSKSVTILESLESIPAADRAGLWVSANKGGRILRYDAQGAAQLVFEEPAIPAEDAAKIKEAAEVVKARLTSLGAELHDGSKDIKPESANNYGYALMLKIGTGEAKVKAVAETFQEELARRGIGYEVEPRLAKDPAFPPYVTFSKLDKSVAVSRVAGLLKTEVKDALILGDSMFAPKPRESGKPASEVQEARELGERLSGQPEPTTGNGTDRDMEKGLPGALALSVGATADPQMANAFVMPGKGPAVTRSILEAVARGRAPAPPTREPAPAEYRPFELPSSRDEDDGWLRRVRRAVSEWARPHLANWTGSGPAAEPAVTDDEVRAAAQGAAAYKGMPWSQTEYNSVLYPAADRLRARGATEAQLELFFRLCAEAPVKGGRFNPWSGD